MNYAFAKLLLVQLYVLLNLLEKLGKRDKMQGLLSICTHFHNKFNKLNTINCSMNVRFYLSYDPKTTLISYFFS